MALQEGRSCVGFCDAGEDGEEGESEVLSEGKHLVSELTKGRPVSGGSVGTLESCG